MTSQDTELRNLTSQKINLAVQHLQLVKMFNDKLKDKVEVDSIAWHYTNAIDDHIHETLTHLGVDQ